MSNDHHILRSHIQNTCHSVINSITSSNLNYSIQQTPYSIYLTIRKSLQKSRNFFPVVEPKINSKKVISDQEVLASRVLVLEEANRHLKEQLEDEIDTNEAKNNTIFELESKVESLHNQLINYATETEVIIAKQVKKCYDEKKALENKHEKVLKDLKEQKSENNELKSEVKNLRIALKSSQKETKDVSHRFDKKIDNLEDKIKELVTFKTQKISEEKEFRNKSKKVEKKLKALEEKEAKVKIEILKLKKREQKNTPNTDLNENDLGKETLLKTPICPHSPQCAERQPYPPPHGPPTLDQSEVQECVARNENVEIEVKQFVTKIMDFYKSEPVGDLDTTIAKLEVIKELLEPENDESDEPKTSEFDELIEMAKDTKQKLEAMKTSEFDEYDDYSFEEDENLPRFYWGGDDCCEMIFYDDET